VLGVVALSACPEKPVEDDVRGGQLGAPCTVDGDCDGTLCIGGVCTAAGSSSSGAVSSSGVSSSSLAADAGQPDAYVPRGVIEVMPASGPLEFGAQRIGYPVEKTVVVTNVGDAPFTLVQLGVRYVEGTANASEFTVVPVGTAPSRLAAGEQFSWRVVHTPIDGVPDRAFLSIATTADNAPNVELELVAEFKGDPALAVHELPDATGANATALFVGTAPLGSTVTRSLYVRNTGAADSALTVDAVSIAGAPAPFAVVAGPLPRGLSGFTGTCVDASTCAAPATTCVASLCTVEPAGGVAYPLDAVRLDVTFTAAAEGTASASLTVSGRLGAAVFEHQVALTAAGLSSALVVEPTPVDFGRLQVGRTAERVLRLTNAGTGLLSVQAVRWLVELAPFSLDLAGHTFPATVPVGDYLELPITFSPTQVGLQEATLEVVLPTRIQVVPVTGVGEPPPPVRSVGGAVTGLLGAGLVVQNNGADGQPLAAGTARYAFPVTSGTSYAISVAVQPVLPSQVCAVANATGTVLNEDVTNADVTCTTNTYAVWGTITGLLGAGLVLQNNGGADLALHSTATSFSFSVASGTPYSITVSSPPTSPSQTCTVERGSGTVVDANVEDVAITCRTNTYAVGGSVTGLSGGGLVLATSTGETVEVPAVATSYAFTLPSGATYAVTVVTQPSQPTQTCAVRNATGTVAGAPVDNVGVTCVTNTYSVGGTLQGLVGTGLVLGNGAGQETAVASGSTTFAFTMASGAVYGIVVRTQPTGPSQNCVVTNGDGTVGGADIDNVRVTCGTNTYSVGGAVNGLSGQGLVLVDEGGGEVTVAPGASSYGFAMESGATYDISVRTQPEEPWQTCSVANGTGTVAGAPVTNATVTCTTNTYRVGGAISGLEGSGLVLQVNGGGDLGIASDATSYGFTRASGTAYVITVKTQPIGPSQTCAVANGTGTVGGVIIEDVTITCTTNLYTVGGTVTGLVGAATVGLRLGGGSVAAQANGPFTFPTPVVSGGEWAVSVGTQPANHQCVVENGTGTMGGSAVTSVVVRCAWNTVLLFATSAQVKGDGTSSHVAARWQVGGPWSATSLGGVSGLGNALVVTGTGQGIALVQATPTGSFTQDLLRFTRWDGSAWSPLADVGTSVFTRSQPSLSSATARSDAASVFHGGDYQHYAMTHASMTWSFDGQVGTTYGPNAPVLQARGADATVAFIRGSSPVNRPAVVDRTAGTWGPVVTVADESASFESRHRPSLVAPTSGPQLMVAWHTWDASPGRNTYKLRYATRTAGTWTAAADITYAWTDSPVALAALPSGDVIAAYRRTDITTSEPRLWTSLWTASAATWSNPRDTGWTLVGAPAITRGVGGDFAEVAFIGTDRRAYHCRMLDSEGECPNTVAVAQDVDFVSLATAP
jgi:hypothetical protein